jgi:hypothetical protein
MGTIFDIAKSVMGKGLLRWTPTCKSLMDFFYIVEVL